MIEASARVLASLIGGMTALVFFVAVQLRGAEPLVPLRMLRSRLVAGANTVTFFLYFALNGMIFFLVLRLQQVQGYSPTEAGLAMLPPILLITFLAAPAGALADGHSPPSTRILARGPSGARLASLRLTG